jgi:hypothetical protein
MDRLKLLARDLTKQYPRSPRDTLAGYVIAARALDKCRAVLNDIQGEYHFNCTLDRHFFEFAGIDAEKFKAQAATGATDAEMAEWITLNARARPRIEIIKWNNRMREMRLSELPDKAQEYMEDYIPKFVPRNRPVYRWFDVYDLEEERI